MKRDCEAVEVEERKVKTIKENIRERGLYEKDFIKNSMR